MNKKEKLKLIEKLEIQMTPINEKLKILNSKKRKIQKEINDMKTNCKKCAHFEYFKKDRLSDSCSCTVDIVAKITGYKCKYNLKNKNDLCDKFKRNNTTK